ncbi:MAG: hypothetical protein WAX77_12455 [Methylococcaceae bacterium]
MNKFITVGQLAVVCLGLLLGGCASEPAPAPLISGEAMLREGQGIADLGDRWKKGKQMVEDGNNMVREGRMQIEDGNRMIEDGQKMLRESEESYKNIKR